MSKKTIKPIKEDGYYVLAKFRKESNEFLGLHHQKGTLAIYAPITSAKRARTRLKNMSPDTMDYKIVEVSIVIDNSTIVDVE